MPSSLSEINPRLHAFFSSRFVIVDAVELPGASLTVAAVASGVVLFRAVVAALGPVAIVAVLAAAVTPFFLTILARFLKDFGGLGATTIRTQLQQDARTKEEEEDFWGERSKISGSHL
jgi:hypothetical protein